MLHYSVQELLDKTQAINQQLDQLTKKVEATSRFFRQSQKVSIWQRYWMVILMGMLSTLITNLIWVLKLH